MPTLIVSDAVRRELCRLDPRQVAQEIRDILIRHHALDSSLESNDGRDDSSDTTGLEATPVKQIVDQVRADRKFVSHADTVVPEGQRDL